MNQMTHKEFHALCDKLEAQIGDAMNAYKADRTEENLARWNALLDASDAVMDAGYDRI